MCSSDLSLSQLGNGAITTTPTTYTGEALQKMLDAHRVTLADGTPNGVTLTPEVWLNQYFSSISVEFEQFKGTHELSGKKMYVEINGTPEELATMAMTGVFTTSYEKYSTTFGGRNVKASATASFTSRKAPYNLQVVTEGMRESQTYGDAEALLGNWEYLRNADGSIRCDKNHTHQGSYKSQDGCRPLIEKDTQNNDKVFEGYIGDPGTGWRVNVSNDSNFAIGNAVIKGGVVLKDSQGAGIPVSSTETEDRKIPFITNGRTDYNTQALVISPALWKTTTVTEDDGEGNSVTKDVLKGGVLADLKLEYFDATNTDPNQAPQYLTIDGLLLRAATNTFTEQDEAAFAAGTKTRPTAAEIADAGISVVNDYVIINLETSKLWGKNNYLRGFEQYFTNFGMGLKQEDHAYMDVYGTIVNQDLLTFGAVFSTAYAKASWDTAVDSLGKGSNCLTRNRFSRTRRRI